MTIMMTLTLIFCLVATFIIRLTRALVMGGAKKSKLIGETIFLGFGFFVVITIFANFYFDKDWTVEYSRDIYALQDSHQYYLNRVHSNSDRYYYMIFTSSGYTSSWASADISYINETSGTPEVKHFKKKFKDDLINQLFVNGSDEVKVEFYVPKGSIKQDFNVDLQ